MRFRAKSSSLEVPFASWWHSSNSEVDVRVTRRAWRRAAPPTKPIRKCLRRSLSPYQTGTFGYMRMRSKVHRFAMCAWIHSLTMKSLAKEKVKTRGDPRTGSSSAMGATPQAIKAATAKPDFSTDFFTAGIVKTYQTFRVTTLRATAGTSRKGSSSFP